MRRLLWMRLNRFPVRRPVGVFWIIFNKGRWKKDLKTDNFLSFFGTFAYSFKNRYVANVTIRNDASNRFGQDINKRFDPTYSFGLAWRAAEENFMREYLPLAFHVEY